jgi:hypothetical protein
VTLNEIIISDYEFTDTQHESVISINHSIAIDTDLNEIYNEFNECLFNNNDLDSLKIRIHNYFVEGKEVANNPVRINRGNKSKICKIMGDIWKHFKTEAISFEYLSIYPDLFDCIKPEEINTNQGLANCNIYKYSMGN